MSACSQTRRVFLEQSLGTAVGIAVLPIASLVYGAENEVILDLNLNENAPLRTAGGALYAPLDGNSAGIIVYRKSETEVSAFSSICTHQGCTVGLPQNGIAECPCHGSQYDVSGEVVQGPAPLPLTPYLATIEGTTIRIHTDQSRVGKANGSARGHNSMDLSARGRTLTIRNVGGESARLQVFAVDGRLVLDRLVRIQSSTVSVTLDNLGAGTYRASIVNEKTTRSAMVRIL